MPNVGHWVGGAAVLWLASVAAATSPDRAGVEFFEQKIRPVLVKHCYSCHSAEAKKVKGGLLLDTRAGMLKGGDTGPAVVPFKVEESLVIKALRHDELAMPPSTKLPDDVIGDFERWIRLGAPDPRDGQLAVSKPAIDLEAGRKFWSFQPLRATPPPTVRDTAWPWTDIDRFLLAALEARGLKPTRDADRETLVRRVTIALTGLPPTPDELDEVCHDPSPAWFERLVDRLLASPHFGERWGRHWLDVARYADSNGKDENLTFHEAFRYRDYVIQAFNTDKPFDRFLIEQLAGDLLPADSPQQRDEQLTATGFLVVGPKVLADRDVVKRRADVIDEQLDTMGRAFLGMTLGCARCHDHKFDPIPSSDYYALAGIFGSTRTLDGIKAGNAVISGWMLRPLGPDGEARWAAHKEHQKKLAALAGQIKKLRDELKGHEDKATMRVPSRLIGFTVDDKEAQLIGTWKPSTFSRPYVGDGYIHDDKSGKGEKSATFTPKLPKAGEYEVFLAYTPGKGRATNVPVTIRHASGETTVRVNQEERPPLDNLFRSVGTFRFEAGSSGSVTISNQGTIGYVIVDAVRFVPTGALGKDPEMAMGVPAEVKEKIADVQARLKALEAEERALKAASPPEPELVMAVRDEDTIEDMRIHLRGNPHALGDVVPRGFLSVLSVGPRPTLPPNQSGRVELAQWLVGPAQPLTSRVFVNRVWKHLFGEGLVRTVDNFGTQGEPPTHPELLDELARRFIADGWSVKKLIRAILLSHAYRLSADAEPALVRADPDNRLFGRACRRRVEAEVIRDSILAVAGTLDRTMGGSSVTNLGERAIDNSSQGGLQAQMESSVRRSVYLPIIRNELPKVFEVFDFADADVSTGRRDTTTVPTQALYLLNSPFVLAQAQQTARRLLALPTDDAGRLTDLYRRALGRRPSAAELAAAQRLLDDLRPTMPGVQADLDAWAVVCQAIFGCSEFRFVE